MVDREAFERYVEHCHLHDNGLYARLGFPSLDQHHFDEAAVIEQIQSGGASALLRFPDGKKIWLDANILKQAPRINAKQPR